MKIVQRGIKFADIGIFYHLFESPQVGLETGEKGIGSVMDWAIANAVASVTFLVRRRF